MEDDKREGEKMSTFLQAPPMRHSVVKEWKTKEGYKAVIRKIEMETFNPISFLFPSSWLCGYVGVPKSHPLYGKSMDHRSVRSIPVHGRITFSDNCSWNEDDFWYFGFDCAHGGDSIEDQNDAYVVKECEFLSDELKSKELKLRKKS